MTDDGITKEIAVREALKDAESQVVAKEINYEIQIKQAESLELLATSVNSIANFLSTGGLSSLLSGYARSQAVKDILGGLATHAGRHALDARTLDQNAVEIVEQVEAVFKKYEERLKDTNRDPELKDAESDYKKFTSKRDGI